MKERELGSKALYSSVRNMEKSDIKLALNQANGQFATRYCSRRNIIINRVKCLNWIDEVNDIFAENNIPAHLRTEKAKG